MTDIQRIAIFPGTFNPFTIGHLDILKRALAIFDKVIVAIGINAKKTPAADAQTRLSQVNDAIKNIPNTEAIIYDGLTVDAAKQVGAIAIVRGIRSCTDFEYERNLADINRRISGLETVMIAADPAVASLSSSVVRELDSYGVDTTAFLP